MLTPAQMLAGYGQGIFPMAESRSDPQLHWVDPRRRGIIPLDRFHISSSLRRRILRGTFTITTDSAMQDVVIACADRDETWINASLASLYGQLFRAGHAHSLDIAPLALDLPLAWRQAYEAAYNRLQHCGPKILLATYFGPLRDNLTLACHLPVSGLHIDAVRAPHEIDTVLSWLPNYKVLSLGVIDGRNVWRADLRALLDQIELEESKTDDLFKLPR